MAYFDKHCCQIANCATPSSTQTEIKKQERITTTATQPIYIYKGLDSMAILNNRV